MTLLPGTCPFIAGGKSECPHGVMCRYFGSHPAPPAATTEGGDGDGDGGDGGDAPAKPRVSPEVIQALAAKRLTTDGDGVLELPAPKDGAVLDEINSFPGDLKLRLRKGQVRFEKSDALLAELGVKTSWQGRPFTHTHVHSFGLSVHLHTHTHTHTFARLKITEGGKQK